MKRLFLPLGAWLIALSLAGLEPALAVEFNRDVRPILSEHCYACHGPDAGKRKAGLRLDQEEEAFKVLKSGNRALVAGDPGHSSLEWRIKSADVEEIMPPPVFGKPLTQTEIGILHQWVADGAHWQKHWSFIPPTRPEPPHLQGESWGVNAVDAFILARLKADGLKPNPEADKVSLLRRVTFDLTGLPPTIAEVDAFLADESPKAYDKVVDRLMASPHYGERMAQQWLDLARYADTAGYHFDGVRFMWIWRDWVINAFNQNQPFDEFTIEQLAGDLLPRPTQSQRIATGFVRNNMTNDEGGADPDEYLDKYVADRVTTVGSVWLGMTVGCTQCHDHKYDPMKTKEFYQLYAFFHNVPEKGLDRIRSDNPPPRLAVPTPEQAVRFVELEYNLKDAEKTLQDRIEALGEAQEKWERETMEHPLAKPDLTGLVGELSAEDGKTWLNGTNRLTARQATTNGLLVVEGRVGQALKLEAKNHLEFEAPAVAFDRTNQFSYGVWVNLQSGNGTILAKMEADPSYRGFDLLYGEGRFSVHLLDRWPTNGIKVRTREQFPQNQWLQVLVTYDGSAKASGVHVFVNGKSRALDTEKDSLTGTLLNAEPLRIGARHAKSDFTGLLGQVRFFDRALSAEEARLQSFEGFSTILGKSRGNRSDAERSDLARFFKETYAVDYLRAEKDLARIRQERDAAYAAIPTTMVMEEMQPPRETFILVRGDFRNKGERVYPETPAFLPPLPDGPKNRLTLARWLMATNQPLTARVVVNRYWAMLFGNGLVKTVNDFGSQGEWPSHPELLDWLAVQFRDGGPTPGSVNGSLARWDVKGLMRLLVTSATYRQSGVLSPEKLERDPYNRLLTRGPHIRLDAEFVRDNALAVSGLLDLKVGGPSVRPYQPDGIWEGVDATYTQDHGPLIFRRGLYVYWRRSAHYPSFATFDAPNREVCTFLRQRTQTPLQSLVLMNDPVYVEAARGLAQRVMGECGGDRSKSLTRAFRHTLGRNPEASEIAVLEKTFQEQFKNFQDDPKAAEAFLKVGESSLPAKYDPAELAALSVTASVLLNLNETITK